MKIKALWGFIGDAKKLGAESPRVKAGQEFTNADDEYAHTLIGKGLVEDIGTETRPKASKPSAPKENK
jgi:hypothetical protein